MLKAEIMHFNFAPFIQPSYVHTIVKLLLNTDYKSNLSRICNHQNFPLKHDNDVYFLVNSLALSCFYLSLKLSNISCD